ncbi:LCP family protein [Deinococcus aquiradiocola]|uniref:Membrane protein n=1 Tax=Deinococcus aquiradiocola TaxID=393059 RepID=A0A917UWB5_9DEIO|nr:LCP family protein [Deinococcus aquiradiocola]GGJ90061.1 membrane protein [Deinococcus aquiradiocola]
MPRFRPFLTLAVVLAGGVALLAPAAPALGRFGSLPRASERPVTLLLAGVTPNYPPSAVWPYPAAPEDYSGLTDTIVLAQVQPDGQVRLLSIPRDTWVNVPGWGYGKINSANRRGGPDTLVQAVQQLTGLRVDAHALLSLNALRDLTDAAGGVNLTVPEDMRYDDTAGRLHINLKAGPQHLNGQQAEGFLRFRHDALGDIGRVSRQQMFLGALAARLRSPLNAWRLPAVVGALDRNASTDLTRGTFGAVLGALLHGPKVSAATLPGRFGPGGTWSPDAAGIRALVQEQFADPGDPRALSVALVNVDAPQGTARRVKARLEAAGYRDVRIVSEDRHALPRTTLSGNAGAAGALRRDLGYGVPDGSAGAPGVALTVRLGADAR